VWYQCFFKARIEVNEGNTQAQHHENPQRMWLKGSQAACKEGASESSTALEFKSTDSGLKRSGFRQQFYYLETSYYLTLSVPVYSFVKLEQWKVPVHRVVGRIK